MSSELTRTDPRGSSEWAIDDDVIHLRRWGSDQTYKLPVARTGSWTVGAGRECEVRVEDAARFVSREHARLSRDAGVWTLQDLDSKNGLWLDDARRPSITLAPGIEVGIGSLRLVAESERLVELRAYLARLIGWSSSRRGTVDRAVRAIRQTAALRAPLALTGDGDLAAIARELHVRAFGAELPFIVADPRRLRSEKTTRSIESRHTAHEAIQAARGGTLCVWANRLPEDFELARLRLADADVRVRLVICHREPVAGPDAIDLVSLYERPDDIDRIIDDYAIDAMMTLGAKASSFTAEDHDWLQHRRPRSISEIARSVERLVAIREWGNLAQAAGKLGITRVALSRWLGRRA